jgi:hypothetical protein
MKTERKVKGRKAVRYTSSTASEPQVLNEAAVAFATHETPMVRTQIYLSKLEHEFVQHESARQGQPMAAIIRAFIEEKMNIPEAAWSNNSLLAPPADPQFIGPEDGAINHDHYVYGTPRKWVKRKGQWVEAPPLSADYHANPARAADKPEEENE